MTPQMIFEFVLGLVRHGMTFGGGLLVTSGIASAGEIETASGLVMSLLGLGWSWYRKWKRG